MDAARRTLGAISLAALMMDQHINPRGRYVDTTPIPKEEQKRRDDSLKLKKGLKEFEIGGCKIVALNYKNAIKKYMKVKLATM